MTQDEIISMAREADIEVAHMNKPMTDAEVKQAFLECFAKRVLWADSLFQSLIDGERAAEREACAKVCEKLTPTDADGVCPVAAAIRARGSDGS